MPCYSPLGGFKGTNGKIHFKWRPGSGAYLEVGCGKCIGCILDKTRDWAIRCTHEAQMHPQKAFITLTYDNQHLPQDGSVNPIHLQNFMKEYRNHAQPEKIRFLGCGEYGEKFFRPHYHLIVFGHEFEDQLLVDRNKHGQDIHTSPTLKKLWRKGHVSIGQVTFQSAAYVARYVTKKVNGENRTQHYTVQDPISGKTRELHPEFLRASNRPGIGASWFEKYWTDVYPGDYVVLDGTKYTPPAYYDKLLEIKQPELYAQVKQKREQSAKSKNPEEFTPQRLAVKKRVKEKKIKSLTRDLENDI